MKLLICLLLTSQLYGAIFPVTGAHSTVQCAGGSCPATPAIDTTGANFVVIVVSYATVGSSLLMTDSKSCSWSSITAHGTPGNVTVNIYYAVNPTVGTGHTFTLTGTDLYGAVTVEAFSGVGMSSPFDQQNGNASASASSLATGSITPAANNELIISGEAYFGDNSLATVSDSMTITDYMGGGGVTGGAMAYKIQTTAAAINPTWTFPTSQFAAVIVASFKASGSMVKRRVVVTQ